MALRGRKREERKETDEQNNRTIEINAQMQGSLTFKDSVNLKINGDFSGDLITRGTLSIGNKANISANINGDNIIIAGTIRGDIIAQKMLILMPTANVHGNIATPKLNIVEGAIFQGNCQMTEGLLDVSEVANYLEIETKEIEDLADSGKIPATKTGDVWKFERAQIENWIAASIK